ncbi:MAG: nuclear transport factor 2 family protein, partial [Bacteroidetes bacterium]|nr:nuclear transport factor 2 family protein [Bacteroidota bacterium]
MQTTTDNQQLVELTISLLHRNILSAICAKNGDFMPDNLHHEFIFTSPRAVVLHKDAFINDLVINPAVQLEIFEIIEEEKVVVCGTAAVLTGTAKGKFKGKDQFLVRITSAFAYTGSHWEL